MSASSIAQATIHSSKNKSAQAQSDSHSNTQNTSNFCKPKAENINNNIDIPEPEATIMQDYDPKYGGKATLFDMPSLKRIKHKISFSGTVVLCVVCYLLYQQFGKQGIGGKTGGNVDRQPATVLVENHDQEGEDIVFRQVDPMHNLDNKVPTFKPPPAHLRPGFIAPPGGVPGEDPDRPVNRGPEEAYRDQPLDGFKFRDDNQRFGGGEDGGFGDVREEDGEWGIGERKGWQEPLDGDGDADIQQARDERYPYKDDQQQYERSMDDDKIAPPGVVPNNEPPSADRRAYGAGARAREQAEPRYAVNRVQEVEKPGDGGEESHDFHAIRQKYENKKEQSPQLADRDLSHYAKLGQEAIAKKQRAKEYVQQENQYGGARANQRVPGGGAGVPGRDGMPGNPYEEYMKAKALAKDVRPHPKDWPVRVLKEPDMDCLDGVEVLVLVHTHPSTFGTRRAIRASWGIQTEEKYPRLGNTQLWKTIFVLGRDDTKQWASEVTTEDQEFGDILQGDFEDNQYEGTRKFLLALEWLTRTLQPGCEPRFILKTEENIYHNMNSVIGWIQAKFGSYEHPDREKATGVYMGKKLIRDIPIRDGRDPYYVPWQDYEKTYFPDMVQGPEFFYDYGTYKSLAKETRHVTKLAMEEGYISLLAERAGVSATHNEHFILLEETSNVCHLLRMFFVSDVKPSEHKKIFKNTREALTNGKCPNAHVVEHHGQRRVNIEM